MPASLVASPNPVPLTWVNVLHQTAGPTTVFWDTGSTQPGRVYLRQGASESLLEGVQPAGAPRGSVTLSVRQADVVELVLREVGSPGRELATATVRATVDPLHAWFGDPTRQGIYGLTIEVGVDEMRVRFRTRVASKPWMNVRGPTGASAGFYAGGKRPAEKHDVRFPMLEQETKYDIEIVADGSMPANDPRNATAKATAHSGLRHVAFTFQKLHMRNDSDPAGSGELYVAFGAGRVGESAPVEAGIWTGDLADGYAVPLSLRVGIRNAPWKVWAQTYGWDDDHPGSFVRFWAGEHEIRYEPAGTWGAEHTYFTEAKATLEFVPDLVPATETVELGQRRLEGRRDFVVSTGNFQLAFSVSGWMDVTRFLGSSTGGATLHRPPRARRRIRTTLSDGLALRWKDLVLTAAKDATGRARITVGPRRGDSRPRSCSIAVPDRIDEVAAAVDPGGHLHLYGVDAEGSLVLGSVAIADLVAAGDVDEDGAGLTVDWRVVPGDGLRDLPVGAASDEGGGHLFGLSQDGQLRHLALRALDAGAAADGWEELGPAPDGVLSVQAERDGAFVLNVVDNADSVRVRMWPHPPDEPHDWVRVGTVESLLAGELDLEG